MKTQQKTGTKNQGAFPATTGNYFTTTERRFHESTPIAAIMRCEKSIEEAWRNAGDRPHIVMFKTTGGITLYCAMSHAEMFALKGHR